MYELPPEQLQLHAKRSCAGAIHTNFANVCDERHHNLGLPHPQSENQSFPMSTLLKPQPKTRVHLRNSGICAKKSVSRGSGAEGDTTSMVRPQRNHHPSQATRRPFSRLFDNGQERNLAHNHACDTGPDEAFGRRCVLQPRILVRSDVLTQKVQHLLDLRR
jgi:hypothetical protein